MDTGGQLYFRGMGEMISSISPEEQVAFLNGLISGHDRLANEIHRNMERGAEDRRPILHDKVARALTELRDYVGTQQSE